MIKYISLSNLEEIEQNISDKTKMIWLETPTNPMMNVLDIKAIAEVAMDYKVLVAVDNTFATPVLQQPLDLGADICMHSATKYLGGHSDLLLGALVVNDDSLYNQLKFIQNTCGAIPGPNDCFLAQRGIKTLHLRMEQSCSNAMQVASFLQDHPKVRQVYYPGLENHKGHILAKMQMKSFGAMVSFDLKNDQAASAIDILERLKVFTLAESLGGVESLCGHPASMSHGSMNPDERFTIGIKDSMIRLSIGIEDPTDLISDLEQAMS